MLRSTMYLCDTQFGNVIPDGKFTLPEDTRILPAEEFTSRSIDYYAPAYYDRNGNPKSPEDDWSYTFKDLQVGSSRKEIYDTLDKLNGRSGAKAEQGWSRIRDSFDDAEKSSFVSDDVRVIKFADLLLSILEFTDGINSCLFGGFVRDLIYREKASDLDMQFTHPSHLMKFLEKLNGKFRVWVYSEKHFLNYFHSSRTKFLLVKIFVHIGNNFYPVDLISIRSDRYYRDKFLYDFSVNMYGLVMKKKLPQKWSSKTTDYERLFDDPLSFFDVVEAIHANRRLGFWNYDKPLQEIWGEKRRITNGLDEVREITTFEGLYETFYFPSLPLVMSIRPRKFLISHNVEKDNEFMQARYQKLIDKEFEPLYLGTCTRKNCGCLMSC